MQHRAVFKSVWIYRAFIYMCAIVVNDSSRAYKKKVRLSEHTPREYYRDSPRLAALCLNSNPSLGWARNCLAFDQLLACNLPIALSKFPFTIYHLPFPSMLDKIDPSSRQLMMYAFYSINLCLFPIEISIREIYARVLLFTNFSLLRYLNQ